jgi:hypothetical protein
MARAIVPRGMVGWPPPSLSSPPPASGSPRAGHGRRVRPTVREVPFWTDDRLEVRCAGRPESGISPSGRSRSTIPCSSRRASRIAEMVFETEPIRIDVVGRSGRLCGTSAYPEAEHQRTSPSTPTQTATPVTVRDFNQPETASLAVIPAALPTAGPDSITGRGPIGSRVHRVSSQDRGTTIRTTRAARKRSVRFSQGPDPWGRVESWNGSYWDS